AARGGLERAEAAGEVVASPLRREVLVTLVAEAVERHLMPAPNHFATDVVVLHQLFAEHEEGRVHADRLERVEHRRSGIRIRPVVEGERHLAAARLTALDPGKALPELQRFLELAEARQS